MALLDEISASETIRTLNSDANAKIKNKALIRLLTKLIDDFGSLKKTTDALSEKFDDDRTSLSPTDFKNAISAAEEVRSDISSFEDGKTMSAAGAAAKKSSRSSTDNWQAELNLASTQEEKTKVWLRFYEKTFGKEHVEQIRKINTGTNAIASECLEMGFDENDNPFIYFLKHNKNLLPVMNQFSYGALHNAFARGYIAGEDLRGKGALGTSSVIFSPSLYRDHYDDLLEYLRLQSEALRLFKTKDFITDALKKRYTNGADFVIDLFYSPGDALAVKRKTGSVKNGLKSLLQIRRELEGCFNTSINAGNGDDAKERLTDSALKALVAKLKGNRDDSIAAVLYAYQKIRTQDNIRRLNAILDRYPEIVNSNLGIKSVAAIDRVGGLIDGYELKPTDFQGFVKAVADAAGIRGGE